MASPRLPRAPRRPGALRALLVTGLAATGTFSVLPAGAGNADPRPSLQEVQRRVDALNEKADIAVEQFAQSKIKLAAARRTVAVAQSRVAAEQVALTAIQKSMGGMVAAAYRTGGTDQFVQLVSTSTPQTFLDRAASLNRIAAGQSAQIAAATTARHRLAAVRADAARAQSAADTVAQQLAAEKSTIEQALADEQRLLNSLQAEERARLERLRQAALQAAQAAADRARAAAERASRSRALQASRAAEAAQAAQRAAASQSSHSSRPSQPAPAASGSSGSSGSSSGSQSSYTGPASGRASAAVQEAYAQLGKPYQWGASGPGSFDCSGLTMWAWGHAGVSLPHSSQAQYGSGQHVSQSDVQPGDLVFFGSPIHHVGIYIGGGNMIDAPQTGDVVKIQSAFRGDYVGAVRP